MTLNELIKELQAWQENGLGELPVFIRDYEDSKPFDFLVSNYELTQIDNKLVFI